MARSTGLLVGFIGLMCAGVGAWGLVCAYIQHTMSTLAEGDYGVILFAAMLAVGLYLAIDAAIKVYRRNRKTPPRR